MNQANSQSETQQHKLPPLTIWIDADAMPREVREVVFRASQRLSLPVKLVANLSMAVPRSPSKIESVAVAHGANMADRHIVENLQPGDLVITADIPLAAEAVSRGACVIDPRGDVLDEANVNNRLASRNLLDAARGAGMEISGPRPYGVKDRNKFAAALDRMLTKALRKGSLKS